MRMRRQILFLPQIPRASMPGTNNDAIAIDFSLQCQPTCGVLAWHKASTTPNVEQGIQAAVSHAMKQSKIQSEDIASVTIGTTAFLNAVLERDTRRRTRVTIIRLSKSFLRGIEPFPDWPEDLANVFEGYVRYVDGRLHIDGSEESPVVEKRVVRECLKIKKC